MKNKKADLTICGLKPIIKIQAPVIEVKPVTEKEEYRTRKDKRKTLKYMVHCDKCEWAGVLQLPPVVKGEVVDVVSIECPQCHKVGMHFRRGIE